MSLSFLQPTNLGDKLWEMGPFVFGLVIVVIALTLALGFVIKQYRKLEHEKSAILQTNSDLALKYQEFVREAERLRRDDEKERARDGRENVKVLSEVSNILTRIVSDQDKATGLITDTIRREAAATKEHVSNVMARFKEKQ
jgi:hypothetical protein